MKTIFNLFNRPFPDSTKQDYLIPMSIGTGLFVSTFLLVFQPFGIAEADFPFKFWKIGGFGVVVGIILFFYFKYFPQLIPAWHQEKNWTIGKEFLTYIFLTICIGIGNGTYSILIGINPFSLNSFLWMLYSTFLVGIFPITFFVILSYIYFLKKHIKEAAILQTEKGLKIQKVAATPKINVQQNIGQSLQLMAENGKNQVSISAKCLLYLESSSNYVTVVYQEGEHIQKTLLRSSLTRLEHQIKQAHILRCHRSFIVNLERVENISGNAQGYKLEMHGMEETVPVARKYAKVIADYFKEV